MALLYCAATCAPARTPAPAPGPATPATPTPDVPEPDAALPRISAFSYSPGAFRYEVVTESVIRQPNDSVAPDARVRTASFVTLRLGSIAGDSLSVQVSLDSVNAERDSAVPAPDSAAQDSALISSFSTVIDAQGMALSAPEATHQECAPGDPAELLAVSRDLLLHVPRELRVGATWSDTSTVTICRGGVPATSGVVRRYEVLEPRRDDDGTALMRVSHTTTFSLAGTQTTEYGQVIALSGTGESHSVLELDAVLGVVRSATREGASTVTVTYGRTSTPFTQRVLQSIRLIADGAR